MNFLFKLIAYLLIWFCAFVLVDMAHQHRAFAGVGLLLLAFWLFYVVALWFDLAFMRNAGLALFIGFIIGCLRLSDAFIPHQEEVAHALLQIPTPVRKWLIGFPALLVMGAIVSALHAAAKAIIRWRDTHRRDGGTMDYTKLVEAHTSQKKPTANASKTVTEQQNSP